MTARRDAMRAAMPPVPRLDQLDVLDEERPRYLNRRYEPEEG